MVYAFFLTLSCGCTRRHPQPRNLSESFTYVTQPLIATTINMLLQLYDHHMITIIETIFHIAFAIPKSITLISIANEKQYTEHTTQSNHETHPSHRFIIRNLR